MRVSKLTHPRARSLPVLRLAFLVLVALNMTIVCQGHLDGNRRVGAHLIVLKDPPFIAEVQVAPASLASRPSQAAAAITSEALSFSAASRSPASKPAEAPLAGSKQPCTVQASSAPTEAGGANIQGAVSIGLVPPYAGFVSLSGSLRTAWTARVATGPDAPPPRIPLPVLS